jgi:hypothetical protein
VPPLQPPVSSSSSSCPNFLFDFSNLSIAAKRLGKVGGAFYSLSNSFFFREIE